MYIMGMDESKQDLLSYFEVAHQFIDEARINHSSVLVNWYAWRTRERDRFIQCMNSFTHTRTNERSNERTNERTNQQHVWRVAQRQHRYELLDEPNAMAARARAGIRQARS